MDQTNHDSVELLKAVHRPGREDLDGARMAVTEARAQPAEPRDWQRISLWDAIRWHWIAFLIPVIVFTGVGVALGLNREPNYTAEAKLAISENIGGPAGLAGFAANSQSLAAGFSQAVDARGVVDPVSQKVGLSAAEVRAQVSASSTAQSPVVRVQTTGASEREAVRLANRSSAALRDYLEEIGKADAVERRLVEDYRQAVLRVTESTKQLDRLEAVGAGQAELDEARATLQADQLVADGAKDAYQTRQANGAALSALEVLSPAAAATSDRNARLQMLAFAGFVVGVAVGAALASLRARV